MYCFRLNAFDLPLVTVSICVVLNLSELIAVPKADQSAFARMVRPDREGTCGLDGVAMQGLRTTFSGLTHHFFLRF